MNLQEIASASALIKQELAPLAEKIGQGAEYTFRLFVRQVYVNALTDMLWLVPGSICLAMALKVSHIRVADTYDKGVIEVSKWSGVFLLVVCGLAMILIPTSGLIQALVNPEYKAIQLIVELFKPRN